MKKLFIIESRDKSEPTGGWSHPNHRVFFDETEANVIFAYYKEKTMGTHEFRLVSYFLEKETTIDSIP